jgi:hypothetical protein
MKKTEIKAFNNTKGKVTMEFNHDTKRFEVECETQTELIFNTYVNRHGAEQKYKLHKELDLKNE